VPEEEDLYDEVDEDAYTEIVAARRKREDFVVDDDGLGYDDDGEDHLFDGPDAATLNKRGVHGHLDAKGVKKAKKLKGQLQANSSLEGGGSGSSVTDAGILGYMKTAAEKKTVVRGPKPVTIGGLSAPAKPSLDLDSMLSGLSAAATAPITKGGRSANPFVKTPSSMRPKAAAWTPAPALSGPADYDADEYQAGDNDYSFDDNDDDYQAGADDESSSAMKDDDGEGDASSAPAAAAASAPRSRFATNAGAAALKAAAEASALKKEQSEAATAAATATAAAAAAPSVKAATLDADMDLDSANNPALASQNAIDTAQWLGKDAESGDSYLDLYWMDAWEQNGAVYLFGKVAVQPPAGSPENTPVSHVSCCVVVKNLQRCMFVLPRALPGNEVDDQTGKLKRFAWPDVHKEVCAQRETEIEILQGLRNARFLLLITIPVRGGAAADSSRPSS